jgi:hypothetical protein
MPPGVFYHLIEPRALLVGRRKGIEHRALRRRATARRFTLNHDDMPGLPAEPGGAGLVVGLARGIALALVVG